MQALPAGGRAAHREPDQPRVRDGCPSLQRDPVHHRTRAINIFPISMPSATSLQNAIDLYTQAGFGTCPRVAILSAVGDGHIQDSAPPSRPRRSARWRTAARSPSGLLDGTACRFDNADRREARQDQGHKVGSRGRAQILVVPDLEAGNMLAKNLAYFAKADGAGIVLGARVPIVRDLARRVRRGPAWRPARSRRSTPTPAGA